jgi:hypothetical protein
LHPQLTGTGDVGVKSVWNDLGVLEDVEILDHEVFVRVEDCKGNELNIYTDLERLDEHLKKIAPGENEN